MSRYFTTPPPVYARNWTNGQNLVESTKIESQQIVPFKKAHRKEKKEKKREKKLKKERSLVVKNYPTKQQLSDESEQLEKSCVTEEQVQSVGYLSDGSQNSRKRIREASPAVESQVKATHVAVNPLRIRFVFKKPKVAASLQPQEERVCSTSGTERLSEVPRSVSVLKTCENDERLLSTSHESDKIELPSELKKSKKHKPSKETRYNTLFDEWVPPCLSLEEDDSNTDDWLFGSRRQESVSTKSVVKKDVDMNKHLKTSEDSSFPRARFMSDVGIFSLPYTVLF